MSWLQKNDSRNYPLVDGAGRLVDGRVIPTNLLCDMHVCLPSYLTGRVYISQLEISRPRAALSVSVEGFGVILTLDVQSPQAYRNYLLQPVNSDLPVHGFVCLSGAVQSGNAAFGATDIQPDQAEVLPSLVYRSSALPYESVNVGAQRLSGLVGLAGESGLQVVVRTIAIPDGDGTRPVQAVVFQLENDLQTLESPLKECQIPLESAKQRQRDTEEIVSLNGVYPDADGQITLEFVVERFTYIDLYGNSQTKDLMEVSAGAALTFRSVMDFEEFCPKEKDRVIRYGQPGCAVCTDFTLNNTGGRQNPFAPGKVFIHRDYLVIEWAYGGSFAAIQGPGTVTLALANASIDGTDAPTAPTFAYDVSASCLPVSSGEATPGSLGRSVFKLDRVFRNTKCVVEVSVDQGLLTEVSKLGQGPLVSPFLSPAFDLCTVQVKDPFLFDADLMSGADQAAIEQEIQDYLDGNPPWSDA